MGLWLRLRRQIKARMMRHVPGMVTCAEFETFVIDYHEGELDDRERRVFERHMRLCAPCAASFTHYRKAITLGREVFRRDQADAPAPVDDRLVKAILAARRSR